MDAGGVRDTLTAVGSTALTLAGAWSLLQRSGRAKSKGDRREIEARAGHERSLLWAVRILRGTISKCSDCQEPETERIEAIVQWEFDPDDN